MVALSLIPASPPIQCTAADLLDKARFALDRQFYAEAGALIVAAEKPDEVCRAVSDTMLAWVATLRTS